MAFSSPRRQLVAGGSCRRELQAAPCPGWAHSKSEYGVSQQVSGCSGLV